MHLNDYKIMACPKGTFDNNNIKCQMSKVHWTNYTHHKVYKLLIFHWNMCLMSTIHISKFPRFYRMYSVFFIYKVASVEMNSLSKFICTVLPCLVKVVSFSVVLNIIMLVTNYGIFNKLVRLYIYIYNVVSTQKKIKKTECSRKYFNEIFYLVY